MKRFLRVVNGHVPGYETEMDPTTGSISGWRRARVHPLLILHRKPSAGKT